MSYVLKLFIKIIRERIYRKLDVQLSNTQFGIRNELGTREAVFAIQVLIQRYREVKVGANVCFIGFREEFDMVKHNN